jgi:hypothetical protein
MAWSPPRRRLSLILWPSLILNLVLAVVAVRMRRGELQPAGSSGASPLERPPEPAQHDQQSISAARKVDPSPALAACWHRVASLQRQIADSDIQLQQRLNVEESFERSSADPEKTAALQKFVDGTLTDDARDEWAAAISAECRTTACKINVVRRGDVNQPFNQWARALKAQIKGEAKVDRWRLAAERPATLPNDPRRYIESAIYFYSPERLP